ncbi:type II TA system antitoxin MqsA family protein [Aureispira sp. CCB-E]|uniref:type II TA system antitoxin MqsA family protein n=1 Tax=Aureispira sp. CCB-E TaxID=3051121 RepID=UPI0028686C2F|nr:type II TA system antitoxin MqsA family protein [Aureispira sp. CCB-E]WMX14727.1 DUF4065 domain-containing protein [Aureispira sp. CCB-E]
MVKKVEPLVLTFRKEKFKIEYHFYLCKDSGEKFTTTKLDEINVEQVHSQYRDKHNLPFIHEIKEIREKYNLSAIKMSQVLGFGPNTYRDYENGEVPNRSNGKIIQVAKDPKQFKFLVEISEALNETQKKKVFARINTLSNVKRSKDYYWEQLLFSNEQPNIKTGYKEASLDKIREMVVYFANAIQPMKTMLNKLLFYSDFLSFRETGYSMSGMEYRAIERGPVPTTFESIFELLDREGVIVISDVKFPNGFWGKKFSVPTGGAFNQDLFSPQELDVLNAIEKKFKKYNTKKIVNASHEELAWLDNHETKSIIDYSYAYYLKHV